MTKEQTSPYNEHTMLVRAGAIWMIMNAENGFKHKSGVLGHMRAIYREDCNDKHNVAAYFQYLTKIFDESGTHGLHRTLDDYNIPKLD